MTTETCAHDFAWGNHGSGNDDNNLDCYGGLMVSMAHTLNIHPFIMKLTNFALI